MKQTFTVTEPFVSESVHGPREGRAEGVVVERRLEKL